MAKIQLWARGFRSYFGWGIICESCQGHMHPSHQPDPDVNCEVCFGMGGSPAHLCPVVSLELETYSELLKLGKGRFTITDKIKPQQLLWALSAIELGLVDCPDSLAAACAVDDLKYIAQFATELQTDIAFEWQQQS